MDTKHLGLSSTEAKIRLNKFGLNLLPEKPPPSSIQIFASQFKNPLVYVLLAAGMVTLFLKEFSDTAIIFFVVLVNSILGFIQEKKASNALESLKKLVHPTSDVYRDGKKVNITIEHIVPGDVIELESGEKIPADGKLLKANRLYVEEAILTGESVPVEKGEGEDVYMGTIVSSGEALMQVTRTGSETEIGKIALSVQKPEEDTPLTKQLKTFSNQLTIIVIVLTIFVFFVGLLTGKMIVEIFETSVALAVSSIPEGLLIALTVVLAVGMQRILAKKGLVRNLVSAETLGGVTTLCVDKTGTLTRGQLEVVEEIGDIEEVCEQHFASADDPIMVASKNWLKQNSVHFEQIRKKFEKDCKLIDSIPFKAENRFFASLIKHKDNHKEVYINGAPELLIEWSDIDEKIKIQVLKVIKNKTQEGKRIIGMAKKNVPETMDRLSEKKIKKDLKWVGLFVFTDPVRKGVRKAFKQTKEAGIKTIVITGDYADTARTVMQELEMQVSDDRILLGSNIEKLTDDQLSKKLKNLYQKVEPILFARTKPEQKLKVINALKKNHEVVAMMGDGVNDAPALHRADIGIVVGEATDVAKESADLVLLDSSFETIVETIKEGRGIFDNIRKIILYLMSDSFEEIIAVVGTIVLSFFVAKELPLPVTAVQILWINIVSDGFPHLSLTIDPKSKGIMKMPPRSPDTNIVSSWMKLLILIVSLTGGLVALTLFLYYYQLTGSVISARSVTFAALGINSLVYVFSVRTLTEPFWKENPLENKWLNLAVVAGLFFQFLPFTSSTLRNFFDLETLTLDEWAVVFISSGIMFIIIEISKVVFRHRLVQKN